MTDPDNAFLTDSRREVLDGTTDWEQSSVRVEKSRIKKRAQVALDELIEVAESHEIDHTRAFDPDDVFRLLQALLLPNHRHHIENIGLVDDPDKEHADDLPDDAYAEHTGDFENYRNALQLQLAKLALENQIDD